MSCLTKANRADPLLPCQTSAESDQRSKHANYILQASACTLRKSSSYIQTSDRSFGTGHKCIPLVVSHKRPLVHPDDHMTVSKCLEGNGWRIKKHHHLHVIYVPHEMITFPGSIDWLFFKTALDIYHRLAVTDFAQRHKPPSFFSPRQFWI